MGRTDGMMKQALKADVPYKTLLSIKVGKRINPISQTLCDDLIRRLGPSLQKHKNCDIIDIFPGTGLLSSRLHNALSPRRHLLLEPNFKNFKPFLTPLLENSKSRYHHLDYDPFNLTTYSRLFEEGHLPEQTEKAEVNGLNNSLLITANLTHHEPPGLSRGFLFMRFMEACLDKSLFNRYGLVRILAALPGAEGNVILPKHMSSRKRTATLVETVASEIAEVATTTQPTEHAVIKGMTLWNESKERAERRQKEGRIYSPSDREAEPMRFAPRIYRKGELFPKRPLRDWHDEFEKLHNAFSSGRVLRVPNGVLRAEARKEPKYKEFFKHQELLSRFRAETHTELVMNEAMVVQKEIRKGEDEVLRLLSDPSSSLKECTAAIDKVHKDKEKLESLFSTIRSVRKNYEQLLQEKDAFNGRGAQSGEPLLLHDRRPYEAMIIDTEELFPPEQMVYVDFQPNPDSVPLKARKAYEKNNDLDTFNAMVRSYSHFLGAYSLKNRAPLGELLCRLFPGRSSNSLIKAIPALEGYAVRKAFQPVSARQRARSVFKRGRSAANDEAAKKELLAFDENAFNYTELRMLPAEVAWDIVVEWWHVPSKTRKDIAKAIGGGMNEVCIEENYEQ